MTRAGLAGKVSFALLVALLVLLVLYGLVPQSTAWAGIAIMVVWLATMATATWAFVENRGRRWAIATLVIGVGLVAAWIVLTSLSSAPSSAPVLPR